MEYAQMIASIVGMIGKASSADEQKKLTADGLAALDKIGRPDLKPMLAEQLKKAEASKQDPRLAAAQQQALEQMQGFAKGEITPADRARSELAQGEAARRGKIQQASILSGAQQRGQLGGGAQLAMQQQAAQGQNEGAYNAALQEMIAQQSRQFGAIGQAAGMASTMSNQDFQRKSATDAVEAANARARMQAQGYNLGIPQKDWENQMKTWAAKTGRQDAIGQQGVDRAKQNASDYGNIGAGVGQMAQKSGGDDSLALAQKNESLYGQGGDKSFDYDENGNLVER